MSVTTLEVQTYSHLPPEIAQVHIGLLKNVKNAAQIRSRIISASTATGETGDAEREAVNFAFIDARTLTGREHLLTAIYVALVAASHSALTTKTVHSEILWALSYSNNITESIRRFGIGDASTSLVIVRVGTVTQEDSQAEILRSVEDIVQGDWTPLEELPALTDWSLVRKYYKLNGDPVVIRMAQTAMDSVDEGKERMVISDIVSSAVAMKSVLA